MDCEAGQGGGGCSCRASQAVVFCTKVAVNRPSERGRPLWRSTATIGPFLQVVGVQGRRSSCHGRPERQPFVLAAWTVNLISTANAVVVVVMVALEAAPSKAPKTNNKVALKLKIISRVVRPQTVATTTTTTRTTTTTSTASATSKVKGDVGF